MKTKWIKKLINKRDWKNYYRFDSSYCNLGDKGKKIELAFCIAEASWDHMTPSEKEGLSQCELTDFQTIDQYRRGHKIYPTPLETNEI